MISVIIPVYNIWRFIDYAVQSIVFQTYQDWETILVDDGSTDGSSELCDTHAAQNPKIKVVHKKNGGLSSARNAGLDVAQGDYVLFLDGDDYLHPDSLSILNEYAKSHSKLDFIQFKFKEVDNYYEVENKEEQQICELKIVTNEEEMFRILYDWGGTAASACTKFIKRTICDKIRFKEGILHEDEDFTTRLLAAVKAVGYCDNTFYYYVKRKGSIIHTGFTPQKMWAITVVEDRIAYLQSRGYKELVNLNRLRLLNTLVTLYQEASMSQYTEQQERIKEKFKAAAKIDNPYVHGRLWALCILNNIIDSLKWYDKVYRALKYLQLKMINARAKIQYQFQTWQRRRRLKYKDFTIISNNCWGGLIYQYFGLPYNSPTVGLFIMDDDYIKFLERFDYYINQPLKFIPFESSRYHDYLSRESTAKEIYPIALLDDVEVHFMHYSSEEEARTKWARRCKRINREHLLVKMSQRYIRTIDYLDRFDALPFKDKICFTEFDYPKNGFVKIEELRRLNIQGGDETSLVLNAINITELMNSIH